MYKCPRCGSTEIVWDSVRGEAVCSSCGLVIEELEEYTYCYPQRRPETDNTTTVYRKRPGRRYTREKTPGEVIRVYKRLFGGWSLRRGVDIDRESLEHLSRGYYTGRVFRHERDRSLEKMLEISPSLKKIYDYTSMFPRLSSRTFRARMLISYMVLRDTLRIPLSIGVMSKAFSVSRNHLERIRRELRRYPELAKFVSDLEIDYREISSLNEYIMRLAERS